MVDIDQLLLKADDPRWMRSSDPPEVPGNYIAHRIKLIHDDSQSIFPESVYSSQTQLKNRWKSLMHSDYVPMEELRRRASQKKMSRPKVSITLTVEYGFIWKNSVSM